MNCLDFRRAILVNPRQPDEGARLHALECATCREFLERQREMDAELFAALQVPPPDGLADRILVARGLRPARRGRLWAIAATVLLASGIAFLGRGLWDSDPVGREAIAHVAAEPQSFTTTQAVGNEVLALLLADQGMKALRALGQVTYSQLCPLDGRVARHLVVRTAEGAVTLLLMPDAPAGRSRAVTQRDGMAAITMPAARGSIAIVAATLSQALAVEKSLRAS
jgi:hypothetical protein